MLHIIGVLLKIIGIILAAILGILVLLLCIVLFVPVRYRAEAAYPGAVEQAHGTIRVTWLLHLVSFSLRYDRKKLTWRLRLAWKTMGAEDEPAEEETGSSADTREEPEKAEELPESQPPERKPEEEPKEPPAQTGTKPEEELTAKPEAKPQESSVQVGEKPEEPPVQSERKPEMPAEEAATSVSEKRPKPVKAKPKPKTKPKPERSREDEPDFWEKLEAKIEGFFEKIEYTFTKICAKIEEITEKKDRLVEFAENEAHRSALRRAKKELVWIRRFLHPQKFGFRLHFGFADPSLTGKVLAGLSMVYPFVGESMNVEPEFEEEVLEGEAQIRGRLRVIYLAILAARMLLDRNVRTTYRDVRNFKL